MAVMEKENKMGFGALVKLRSLEKRQQGFTEPFGLMKIPL